MKSIARIALLHSQGLPQPYSVGNRSLPALIQMPTISEPMKTHALWFVMHNELSDDGDADESEAHPIFLIL